MKSIYEYLVDNQKDLYGIMYNKNSRFWIHALENITIKGDIEVSEDERNWDKYDTYKLDKGECIYLFINCKSKKLEIQGKFEVGGNILGLTRKIYSNSEILDEFEYFKLFEDSNIISAKELDLSHCEPLEAGFRDMFAGCKLLEEAPELPIKRLAKTCYESMFERCTSLKEAPKLPATILAECCYRGMFERCTSLKEPPELPATRLEDGCYWDMFAGCTSLQRAPELPATKLATWCYDNMFCNCELIKEAPELPVKDLESSCYESMFGGCTSLQKAPELPATELAPCCYKDMFIYCTSLKETPELPATQLVKDCYDSMFKGCKSLQKASELPAKKLAPNCYKEMFCNCPLLDEVRININTKYYNVLSKYLWKFIDGNNKGIIYTNPKIRSLKDEFCIPRTWEEKPL